MNTVSHGVTKDGMQKDAMGHDAMDNDCTANDATKNSLRHACRQRIGPHVAARASFPIATPLYAVSGLAGNAHKG
jgi:hypothetical protein